MTNHNNYAIRTLICIWCKKVITERQPKGKRFCGIKCGATYNASFRKKSILKICPICNKSFEVKPSTEKRRRCCSKICMAKYNTLYRTGINGMNYKDGSCIDPTKFKEYKAFKERRRNFQKRTSEKTHSLQEWKDLKEKYKHTCLKCFKREPNIKLTEDHIIPISLNGHDGIDNIQPMCISCNSKKHNKIQDYRNRIIYIE